MQFDDLNNDVLLEIFDTFSLDDLLSLADMNPRFRELIVRHPAIYKFRINEQIIAILAKEPRRFDDNHIKSIQVQCKKIELHDYLATFKFLRNFGQIIAKITIDKYRIQQDRVWHDEIDKYVNKYCSDSLEELNIYDSVNTTYAWKKPFKNLTNMFALTVGWTCEHTNFSEILPSLQSLRIRHNLKCFNQHHFPHLEDLAIDVLDENGLKFFESNPQLRRIQINDVHDIDCLRFASKNLQNVELINFFISLPAISEEMKNELIHFKNVKKGILRFHLQRPDIISVFPFVFEQLEELEIETWYEIDAWKEFIIKHSKLQVLTISRHLYGQQFVMIIEKMLNLVEINIGLLDDIGREVISCLMRNEINLKKIKFKMTVTIERCEIFYNSLSSRWQQIGSECTSGDNNVILIRKENDF